MKVVLLEEVPGLGRVGEVVPVADGYGRNYLFPRRLATPATPSAIQQAESIKAAEARRQARTEAELGELAQKLQGITLKIQAKVGAEGKLYGSVTSAHIARELRQLGIDVDRRKIELGEPIRRVGDYPITIHITRELAPQLTVAVAGE